MTEPYRDRRRPALAAVLALALIAVVALASRGRSWSGGSAGSRTLSEHFWNGVFSVGFVLWIVAAVLAFRVAISNRRELVQRRRRRHPAVVVATFLGTFLLILFVARHLPHFHRSAPAQQVLTTPAGKVQLVPGQKAPRGGAHDLHVSWPAVAATLAVLAALALAAELIRRRSLTARLRPELTAAAALAQVLDETLDDLRRERDPRRAVIAAYARMERTLAAYGLGRAASEAPEEYLRRVLGRLDATAASAERLTALFEWAKFSHHEVGGEMKNEAIDALVALRTELAGAA